MPNSAAQTAFEQFERDTRSMGDDEFLEACDELECLAKDSSNAKREEMKDD